MSEQPKNLCWNVETLDLRAQVWMGIYEIVLSVLNSVESIFTGWDWNERKFPSKTLNRLFNIRHLPDYRPMTELHVRQWVRIYELWIDSCERYTKWHSSLIRYNSWSVCTMHCVLPYHWFIVKRWVDRLIRERISNDNVVTIK